MPQPNFVLIMTDTQGAIGPREITVGYVNERMERMPPNMLRESLRFTLTAVQGVGGGLGFMLAMLLMSEVRERLDLLPIPRAMRGVPIAFITAGLMGLAFFGFAGIVK